MKHEAISSTEPDIAEVLTPPKRGLLKRLGAGSLAISVIFHAVLVAVGIFIVVANIPPEKEKEVDFRARGGGGGSPASSSAQKKMQVNMSRQMPNRVAAANVASSFVLPEPATSGALSALGSIGSGVGGLGGPGSGGGSGAGTGIGTGNGMGMGVGAPGGKGLMVFGTALQDVRSIGVVMDVSGSMTRHLPRVLEELDRVAKGSPVILHVGCGIGANKTRPKIDSVSSPMRGGGEEKNFKGFWCFYQDPYYRNSGITERGKVDLSRSIPSPEVYESFAERSGTYFNDPDGPKSTADALLAREFEKVDAIYWFADFQDKIDEDAAEDVLRTLKRRRQKLYIHASQQGNYIAAARDLICLPSGGKEIVTNDPTKKGK